jgi:hypothetical protein
MGSPKPQREAIREPKWSRVEDFAPYAAAIARLEKINQALAEARRRLQGLPRVDKDVRAFLERSRPTPAMMGPEFDDMCRAVAASDGKIPGSFIERLRSQAPSVRFDSESKNREAAEFGDFMFSVGLLQRAAALQEKSVAAEKNRALAEIIQLSRGERGSIAARVADAALALATLLSEDEHFIERLRRQDEALVSMLNPPPFPVSMNSYTTVHAWIASALGISEADVRARIGGDAARAL